MTFQPIQELFKGIKLFGQDVDIFWMHLFHVFIGLACLALLNATEPKQCETEEL